MSKRIAAIALAVTFISLAIAPETLAQRYRRDCNRSVSTRYYGSYPSRYYGSYPSRYYGSYPYSGVAGQRYYAAPYYNRGGSGTRYYGEPYYRGRSTRNLVLTVAAPAAIGAGVGAIAGGGKGAGIGALVGGGGGALYYLLRNRNRRY